MPSYIRLNAGAVSYAKQSEETVLRFIQGILRGLKIRIKILNFAGLTGIKTLDQYVSVLNTYSKISTDLDDDLSLGRAYEAIAKVLQSQGEMTEAIKYLKKVVKIARNNFQKLDVVRASTMLGDIYNEKGYYNKASQYFQQAFDTTAELTNLHEMDETKVHYGIAKAHQIMLTVNNYIESEDLTSLDYLLSWKENRGSIVCDPTIGESRKSTMESLRQVPENLEEECSRFPDNQKNET
uniref:tetratricopeptide repeat protein 29-like n=1 Tax=Halichoerus grypus TaxID=9711 RepID=UPI001658F679|nr:tetratricopeptide repeat protein 29-like [Halichoerus grypus]